MASRASIGGHPIHPVDSFSDWAFGFLVNRRFDLSVARQSGLGELRRFLYVARWDHRSSSRKSALKDDK